MNIQKIAQRTINIRLEGYKYIRKAKRYNLIFKVAIPRFKGGFLFITFINTNIIVYILKVELYKNISA